MGDAVVQQLIERLGKERVLDAIEDRSQWASDASIYHLLPRVVVIPKSAQDVAIVLKIASAERVHVCFRAGGTSLSGQAVTDGILIVVSRHLRGIRISEKADTVTCEPGAVGAWVNAALAPHGRRIGPDPASIQAAEIGGIVANNASGMCCGVSENSYHTIAGLEIILSDGNAVTTDAKNADHLLAQSHPHIHAGLTQLSNDIRQHPTLPAQIRAAFSTKNTVGYSLNAFLDHDSPVRILEKLVIGSEGTLAFIASATFRTLALPTFRATAWLLFSDVDEASRAVAPLAHIQARAIELLDAVALRRIATSLPHELPAGDPAALLVEFQESDESVLETRLTQAAPLLINFNVVAPALFTRDAAIQASYWKLRKGLFPSVGAIRAAGTAVVIEDVTFPVEKLAEGIHRLRACFTEHGYDDAVIFGHAKDGNLHFTLTPNLSLPDEVDRYDRFMHALVDLVLDMGGHLKAEHGTGRNMAPFVERQWGTEAVAIMRRIKKLFDPHNIVNPGVLLSDDPQAHLKHLKTLPSVHETIDRCIECGFCEPVCPSRDVTYSPRQRIAALRAIARAGADGSAISSSWQHRGLDTCAADGMCESACPVHINTGELVRIERASRRSSLQKRIALFAADHFDLLAGTLRLGLRLAHFARITHLPKTTIPLPPPAAALPNEWPQADDGAPTIIYFPSCLGRTMGPGSVAQALADCCRAAGVGLIIPDEINNLCCGQPFISKGFPEAARVMQQRSLRALCDLISDAENSPIFMTDTSTCAGQLHEIESAMPDELRSRWKKLQHLHPAEVIASLIIPRLKERQKIIPTDRILAIHPTCSEHRHGWSQALTQVTATIGTPLLPMASGCCGMAGDKGWSVPGLPAAASKREANEVMSAAAQFGVTTSTTCALAMSSATNFPYQHLFFAVHEQLIDL